MYYISLKNGTSLHVAASFCELVGGDFHLFENEKTITIIPRENIIYIQKTN